MAGIPEGWWATGNAVARIICIVSTSWTETFLINSWPNGLILASHTCLRLLIPNCWTPNTYLIYIKKRFLTWTDALFWIYIPDHLFMANFAFLGVEIPLSATSHATIIESKIGSSFRADAVLIIFMQNKSWRTFHALFRQRTPEWWGTAYYTGILVIEEGVCYWAFTTLAARVVSLSSWTVLAVWECRIPKLRPLAGDAYSTVW